MYTHEDIVAVIPSRTQSIRLPNKPLIKVGDKELIHKSYNLAKESDAFGEVFVACDRLDDELINYLSDMHIPHVLTVRDHENGTSRIAEASEWSGLSRFQFFCNFQGDIAHIDTDELNATTKDFLDLYSEHSGMDAVFTVTSSRKYFECQNPSRVYCLDYPYDDEIIYGTRDQTNNMLKYQYGIYFFSKYILLSYQNIRGNLHQIENLEYLKFLHGGVDVIGLKSDNLNCFEINTREDIENYERIFKK